MKKHPIEAALFLILMFSAIGALAVSQLSAASEVDEESPAEKTPNEAQKLTERIRAAVQHGIEGRLSRAQEELRQLAEEYPNEVLVWMNYGVALSGRNEYDAALDAFRRALELRPETWAAYGEIATIHRIRGDLGRAFDALEKIPPGKGRLAERLHRDPGWRDLDDPRLEKIRREHREIPETSLHIDDVTANP